MRFYSLGVVGVCQSSGRVLHGAVFGEGGGGVIRNRMESPRFGHLHLTAQSVDTKHARRSAGHVEGAAYPSGGPRGFNFGLATRSRVCHKEQRG